MPPSIANTLVRFHEGFFIAEPEVNLLVNLRRNVRLTAGAGYRLTSGGRDTDNRLRGATGSIALQISSGT